MENISSIISSILLVVGLLYVVCLGWNIPFSFGKAVGVWAGIILIKNIKNVISYANRWKLYANGLALKRTKKF